jgi:hypothetical protein
VTATVGTIGTTVPSSINKTATATADDAATVSSTAVVNVNANLVLTKTASAGDSIGTPTNQVPAGSDVTYQLTVACSRRGQ